MAKHLGERKEVKSTLEEFNFNVLLKVVKSSVKWGVLFLVVCLLAAYAIQRWTPNTYETYSDIMLKSQKSTQVLGLEDLLADDNNEIELEIQLLKSKLLIEKAVKDLPLSIEYYAKGTFMSTEYYKNAPFEAIINIHNTNINEQKIYIHFSDESSYTLEYELFGEDFIVSSTLDTKISTPHFDILLSSKSAGQLSENDYYIIPRSYASIVDEIAKEVKIIPINIGAKTIQIRYQHLNAEKAHDIVDAITNTFIAYDEEKKSKSINGIIGFLDVQIESFGQEFYSFQDTLKKFRYEMGFMEPASQVDLLLNKIDNLEERNMSLRFDENILKWFMDYIDSEKNLTLISPVMFQESSFSFDREILSIVELETDKTKKLLTVTTDHPEIIIINNQLEALKLGLLNQVELALEKIQTEQKSITKESNKYYNELYTIPDKETAFSRLQRENEVKEKFFLDLIENKNKYLIARAGIVSDYIILQKVFIPKTPIAPNKNLIWLMGLAASIFLIILLIAVRYLLHQKITSTKEIENNSNAHVLGLIPKNKKNLSRSQVVVTEDPKSSMSEAFRSIRSNMEFITSKNTSKLIVTTSTIPGEGKTFVGINLAAIFSLMDKKVIILDFDLRKPRLAKIFGTDSQKGISNYLIGKCTLNECVLNTGIKNLDFIPSGPVPPNPAELVSKQETKDLIAELQQHYDYVFIDTPPVGLVTDALDLLKIADYPLYVVRADYSERKFLENVNRLIFDNDISKLSVVLNGYGRGGADSYGYGYGYGYGAGYYSDDIEIEEGWWFKIKKLFSK